MRWIVNISALCASLIVLAACSEHPCYVNAAPPKSYYIGKCTVSYLKQVKDLPRCVAVDLNEWNNQQLMLDNREEVTR